jgi:hypothetical protein
MLGTYRNMDLKGGLEALWAVAGFVALYREQSISPGLTLRSDARATGDNSVVQTDRTSRMKDLGPGQAGHIEHENWRGRYEGGYERRMEKDDVPVAH